MIFFVIFYKYIRKHFIEFLLLHVYASPPAEYWYSILNTKPLLMLEMTVHFTGNSKYVPKHIIDLFDKTDFLNNNRKH